MSSYLSPEVRVQGRALLMMIQAVRPVGSLHCTLGVMSLDQNQLSQVTAFLEALDVQSLLSAVVRETRATQQQDACSQPLVVNLKGLESMHAPEKTSILYSPPFDKSGRLYPFCLAVQQLFKDHGFLVEDDRKLKLHATIVNTIYAKGKRLPTKRSGNASATKPPPSASGTAHSVANANEVARQDDSSSQGHGPVASAPLKLDARPLLDKYQDFVWAENVTLDRLAICGMGAKKLTDNDGKVIAEQYTEIATIALPA